MRFRFKSKELQALYAEDKGAEKLEPGVVKKFFKTMAVIAAVSDEREFYDIKSLHYEKLEGDRDGQRSMRLNRQWRLIIEIEEDEAGRIVLIISIEDYH